MFWASRLDVLHISRAPTITLPAFVMAEKLIVPSLPTTRPSVATFACTIPRSISIASSSTPVLEDVPDSQKLTFRMTFLRSTGVAVAEGYITSLFKWTGSFLYSVFTCVSLDAAETVHAAKYLSTKSPQFSPFALMILASFSSADNAGSGQAANTVSRTTRQ